MDLVELIESTGYSGGGANCEPEIDEYLEKVTTTPTPPSTPTPVRKGLDSVIVKKRKGLGLILN